MIGAIFRDMDWDNWIRGLLSGFIGGGAGAAGAGLSVAIQDPKDYSIGSGKFFMLVATVFVVNGTFVALAFLKQNPLPAIKTETTVKKTEIPEPGTKVETTVKTTEVAPAKNDPA